MTKITELDQADIDEIRSSYPREFWQDVYALRTLEHVIDEIVLDIPDSEEYIPVRSYIDDIIGFIEECVDFLDGYHKEEYDPDEPPDIDKSDLAELLKDLASDMAYQYSESPSMQGIFPNSYNNKSASVQENINQNIEAFWDSANNAVSNAVSDLQREEGYNSKLYFPNTKRIVE